LGEKTKKVNINDHNSRFFTRKKVGKKMKKRQLKDEYGRGGDGIKGE